MQGSQPAEQKGQQGHSTSNGYMLQCLTKVCVHACILLRVIHSHALTLHLSPYQYHLVTMEML